MKSLNKALSIAAILGLALTSAMANAAQKVAVVDVQLVLQSLPQVAVIEQTINEEFQEQIQEMTAMREEGSFLVEKLQREAATMSEEQQEALRQQIQTLSQTMQQKGGPLQQNMQNRTTEERNKLLSLIKQAVDSIAAAEDYDMVINAQSVPFAKDEFDISQKVLDQVSKAN
ncbi:OmpH family outer membrane protein [Glaciecola sp. XM2]|uniref:OmpH family outer membrane protein n=1 Tax=Glaciecola sp. XM2 TaxID=1914931 RepID=UPI00203220E5|nr:OmpH family outer membrane protein [Glaciecola sp. XM2]